MKRSAWVLAAAAALLSGLSAPAFAQRAGATTSTQTSSGASRFSSQSQQQNADQAAQPTSSIPAKLDKAAIARGMKEAPTIQQASGQPCQVSNAAFRGEGSQKGPDGKSRKVTIYETACTGSLGYILVSPQGASPQAFDCLASQGTSTTCLLPENADPKAALTALAATAGAPCQVTQARYMGTGTNQTFYELACSSGPGEILLKPASGPPQIQPCAATFDTPLACQYTTKAQVITALAPVVQKSGRTCQVSDVRWLGSTATGDSYYEFGCGSQPGFVAKLDKANGFEQAIDCSRASGIAGGCKFTSAAQSAAADNAGYTTRLRQAGYACQVSKARLIGTDGSGRDVVEVACADHPDGALALLSKTGGPSEVVDCGRAAVASGQSCQLTDPKAAYPKYTAALATKVKAACPVSNTAYHGTLKGGEQLVEVACGNGARGYVIGFNGPGFTAQEVFTCSQARFQGLTCKLPGNNATAK